MPGFVFTNSAMLAGLAALGVPVLIHLLMRRKAVVMRFSSVQFFNQQEEHARKRNLRNFLLLLLRLLLLALLVTAFARPYSQKPVATVIRKRVVFVVDASASMQAKDGAATRWEKARDILMKEIRALDPEDHVSIVRCSTDAETFLPLSPPETALARIVELTGDFAAGDLAEGLQLANRILRVEGEGEICVISDLQRSGCERISSVSIPSAIKLRVISVGDGAAANCAITSIESTNGHHARITAVNFSVDDAISRTVELTADGQSVGDMRLRLDAGATTNMTMALPRLAPGWHEVRAKLSGADVFSTDDSRALAIFIPNPLRILCAEPAMERRVFEQETFFLDCALKATVAADDTDSATSNIEVEKLGIDRIARAINTPANAPDVLVLPALSRVPAQLQAAVESYLQQGGKVITFAGDLLLPNVYRDQLGKVLPAIPLRIEGDAEQPDQFWHLQTPDPKSPIFAVFSKPNSGNVTLAEFKRRCVLVPAPTSEVLAKFEDGAPFMVSRRVGSGQIVFVNTSATTSWTDWPKRKTFVPWLHSLAQVLAGGERGKTVVSSSTCGDYLEMAAAQPLNVQVEGGASKTVNGDAAGKARIDLDHPGVYRVSDSSGRELQRVAVNVPPNESDLMAMPEGEFLRKITRTPVNSSNAEVAIDGVRQRPLWPMLLGACLVLLIAEVVLANRTTI